jgi:hypothetical protein
MQHRGHSSEYTTENHVTWESDGSRSKILHTCGEHFAITSFLEYCSYHGDVELDEFIQIYCQITGENPNDVCFGEQCEDDDESHYYEKHELYPEDFYDDDVYEMERAM